MEFNNDVVNVKYSESERLLLLENDIEILYFFD